MGTATLLLAVFGVRVQCAVSLLPASRWQTAYCGRMVRRIAKAQLFSGFFCRRDADSTLKRYRRPAVHFGCFGTVTVGK
jgi:hypothetical protein